MIQWMTVTDVSNTYHTFELALVGINNNWTILFQITSEKAVMRIRHNREI